MPEPVTSFVPCGVSQKAVPETLFRSGEGQKLPEDAVVVQMQQMEQRLLNKLQGGLDRVEKLIMTHGEKQNDFHEMVSSHPLLSQKADDAATAAFVKGVPISVTILGATNVKAIDAVGLSDPFCVCTILGVTGLPIDGFKTSTVQDSKEPIWNQSQVFPNVTPNCSLKFTVSDKDQARSKLLGHALLANADIFPDGFQGDLTLTDTVDGGDGCKQTLAVKIEILGEDGLPKCTPPGKLDMTPFNKRPVVKVNEEVVVVQKSEPVVQLSPRETLKLIILGRRFETFSIMIILINGMFIGYQADFSVKSPKETTTAFMDITENVFFTWFWAELIAKCLVDYKLFYSGHDKHWNAFDTLLMVSGTIQSLAGAGGVGASVLRCCRAGRVVRLAPFIKTNPNFKELRLMLYGTLACFRGLGFAFVMLVSIMYLFGMVFMGGAAGFLRDDPMNFLQQSFKEDSLSDKTARHLTKFYGTLPITMRTLFRVISGGADWFDASECLWDAGLLYGLLFTLYIYLMLFGVLNVLVGVFVDSAMATASMDADILAREEEEEKRALEESATTVLMSVDKDGSGTVTWEEFEANLEIPQVVEFLDAMQINAQETKDLFEMVDNDSSGFVNIGEFMECCMKLKSGANLNTIVTLLYETKAMATKEQAMLAELRDLSAKQTYMNAEVHELISFVHARICP